MSNETAWVLMAHERSASTVVAVYMSHRRAMSDRDELAKGDDATAYEVIARKFYP